MVFNNRNLSHKTLKDGALVRQICPFSVNLFKKKKSIHRTPTYNMVEMITNLLLSAWHDRGEGSPRSGTAETGGGEAWSPPQSRSSVSHLLPPPLLLPPPHLFQKPFCVWRNEEAGHVTDTREEHKTQNIITVSGLLNSVCQGLK